jgi:hypothetical protein
MTIPLEEHERIAREATDSRSQPYADAQERSPRTLISDGEGGFNYGSWRIYFDPPPIPTRTCDWHFYCTERYDCDGDSEGFYPNAFGGSAASVEACVSEIEDIEADHG